MHAFPTTAPIAAVVEIPAGRIQLIAAERQEATVEIRPADPASKRDVAAAENTTVTYQDGTLRIEAAPAAHRLLGSSGSIELTVQLPAGSRVQAKLAAGEVRGVGRLGELVLDAAAVTVKLDETETARLTLDAGDITVGRLTGCAACTTRKGRIEITEAVRGELTVHTDQGSITLGAARGTGAALDATTTHGRIHNSLTNTQGPDPDLTVHASTFHGDITARSL